jgi:thymidylate synthase
MEFVWMMAGSRQTDWVSYFNSNMEKYSLKNVLYGAYGYRWRNHWGADQLRKVVRTLQRDPTTRQAVLQMWDPVADLDTLNPDKPCNTTIYFRLVNDQLNMTVCNRSNDLIWGMLGANAVHMTLLHELIAAATNLPLGHYQVFTNNLHIYTELPNYEKLINTFAPDDPYSTKVMNHVPVLQPEESFEGFLRDCQMLLEGDYELENNWLRKVALPAHHAYRERKDKSETGLSYINSMPNCDWKLALQLWVASHF